VNDQPHKQQWRETVYRVIFRHERGAAKAFDVLLIIAILASVAVVMLDSVSRFRAQHGDLLIRLEWIFTILFTVEYALRLMTARDVRRYAFSFYGLVDLFSVLPTYLSLIVPGGQYLIVIRILRVLRIFRVLKLAQYVGEANVLTQALRESRYKITVFVFTVLTIVAVVGSLMYLIEGPESGFTSIPRGVYWAVVTLTTVGYGDIAPVSAVGQGLAAMVMIMGYGIIAVPTGIVTAELVQASSMAKALRVCEVCDRPGHDPDAGHCKHCGARLPPSRSGELGT
jgi:voltage-gated potassium channel